MEQGTDPRLMQAYAVAKTIKSDDPRYEHAQRVIAAVESQGQERQAANNADMQQALDVGPVGTFANAAAFGLPGLAGGKGEFNRPPSGAGGEMRSAGQVSADQNPKADLAGTAAGIALPIGVGAIGAGAKNLATRASIRAVELATKQLALKQAAAEALGAAAPASGRTISAEELKALLRLSSTKGHPLTTALGSASWLIPSGMSVGNAAAAGMRGSVR